MRSPRQMALRILSFSRVSFSVSRLLGSMPLNTEIESKKLIHKWSYFGVIQTLLFSTFTMCGIVCYFHCFPKCFIERDDLPTVTRFSQAGHFFILLLLGTLSICIHVIKIRHFPDLFKSLSDVKIGRAHV